MLYSEQIKMMMMMMISVL